MKNNQYLVFCLLLSLQFTALPAFAEDRVTSNIVEISTGIGHYNFSDDRNLDNEAMLNAGLGLQFSRRWLMLLHYSALKYDSDRPKVLIQKYHVDAHYFFNTEDVFRPYIVAGFGQLDVDDGVSDSNENMFNAGFGLSYKIAPPWFIRGDIRAFSSTDGDYNENAITLTLGYRFSGGESD